MRCTLALLLAALPTAALADKRDSRAGGGGRARLGLGLSESEWLAACSLDGALADDATMLRGFKALSPPPPPGRRAAGSE